MLIHRTVQTALTAVCVLSSPYLLADSSLSFSFAPPPITSIVDDGERVNKVTLGYTFLEYDSSEASQEFSLLSANILSKKDSTFFSLGLTSGEDDTGNIYLLGLNGQYGIERAINKEASWSVAGGLSYLYTEFDSSDIYSETEIVTGQVSASIQQRFPLAERVGITPYLLVNAVLFGTGSGFTNISSGVVDYDIDIDPYVGITLGFDLDFHGYSLAALYQSADDSSITSLSFGFEF